LSVSLQPDLPIFVVDDEQDVAEAIERTLVINGYNNIFSLSDSREVINKLNQVGASLILLDITMPHLNGEELLEEITSFFPEVPIVMATARDSVEVVVKCMKKGAYDYIKKPLSTDRLLASISGALELRDLRRENKALRYQNKCEKPNNFEYFNDVITRNTAMLALFRYIETIALSTQVVAITGETGVGKELIAKSIHMASGRKGKFVAVNIAGVDDEVFSDTLFGHVKGAYTGANISRGGQIKEAEGGTLFLDEIGDLSYSSQVKLLRLLQEKKYLALGSDAVRTCDARIVVATNRNFDDLVEQGTFRKDLYYRLNTHHVTVPPLRERFDDLPLLVEHFLQLAASELGKKVLNVTPQIYPYLRNHSFPGNIRELQAIILNAVSRQQGSHLGVDVIRLVMQGQFRPKVVVEDEMGDMISSISFGPILPTIKEARETLTMEAIKRANGSITLAAKLLGVTRQALGQYLQRNSIAKQ
jgi:DNA-binding NtrC family response regulator